MTTGVLIATYNGEKFIIEQLESIINQSVAVDEIIISDDDSTDRTIEVVLDFIEIYLVSHLGDFLFQNWHNFSKLAYPMSIRYQLLYSLGANMKIHHFMGIHTYLIFLALSHIIIICSMLCIHKDGKSAWAYMK